MKLTFIEHACVLIECAGKIIVTDPYITDTEAARRKTPQLFSPDVILLTHGHGDHTAALSAVYKKGKTTIVAIVELCAYLKKQGYDNVFGLNFGGSATAGGVRFSLVPAKHTSASQGVYLGEAAGFVVEGEGKRVYHAGDTDVFGDMVLIERFYHPDVGLLPIGGRYTMDAERAAFCANEYFSFKTIVPIHYGTFAGIEADPAELSARLKKGAVAALRTFESLEI